ncbi:MAG: DUF134 domain-containing protein [Peptococcaceae bacterium]|nr:DUF134 domain-containing protein [Peptococcaceae bacterium]
MPRPIKRRLVCSLPEFDHYAPVAQKSSTDVITMSIEEFETIRLIDHEGLEQEECALRMGVGRSTVQRIYNEARKKIAESLVQGKTLKIAGGNYAICSGEKEKRGCGNCRRHQRGRNR